MLPHLKCTLTRGESLKKAAGDNNDKVYIDIIVDITDDTLTLIDDEGKRYTNTRVK